MTIVEIMVATLILFIGVTAILGLMASSLRMGIMSKQGNITTNAVSSFIEQIRAMPYEEIGIIGGDPPGSLEASQTLTPAANFTIDVSVSVDWVDDPNISGGANYKRLRIVAVASRDGSRPYRYTTETLIRNEEGRPEDAEPPLVAFGALTPAQYAVVSGQQVLIDWTASTPMVNGLISKAYLLGSAGGGGGAETPYLRGTSYIGGVDLGGGVYGAEWLVNSPAGTGQFYWDTTMMTRDDYGNETTDRMYPDGTYTVYVEAWDNLVQKSSRMRKFIVDNDDPNAVTRVWDTPMTATTHRVDWDAAMDGSEETASYRVRFYRQLAGQNSSDPYTWTLLEGSSTAVSTTLTQATQPFSRYLATVQSLSAGGRESSWSSIDDLAVTEPYVTRPRLSGTYVNTFNGNGANRAVTTDITVNLSPPAFSYTGLTSYLYRSTSPDMSNKVLVVSGSGFSYTHRANSSIKIGNGGTVPRHYYQVQSVLKPSGYPSGSDNEVLEMWSNVMGPNGQDANGSMPEVW